MKKLTTKRFIIVGPSGVGKSTLIKMILQIFINIRVAISCTTRALRKSEVHGVHYFKWSWIRFMLYRLFGKFAEVDHHHGKWYGTLNSQASIDSTSIIFDVDVNGALNLQKLFPDAVTIFIHPPQRDPEELRKRLEKRAAEGDGNYSEIDKRVKRYEYEKTKAGLFKYQLTNDDLFACFAQLAFIIYKELGGTVIAIDGTAGCGKGTHAKNLANEFNGVHLR
jgi:guanylate kinase